MDMPTLSLRDIARAYLRAGWHPFELPAGSKGPPPTGRTGYDGVNMTAADVEAAAWAGGIGIRMPFDVIGLDVDAYHGGLDTLKEMIEQYGPLPKTWISHSGRNDDSGIRVFRVPVGMAWIAGLPGIEIIQQGHRYAAAWPSMHPEGRQYGWWNQLEQAPTIDVPLVEDLPDLPWPWQNALSRATQADVEAGGRATAASFDEVQEAIGGWIGTDAESYIVIIVEHFVERWRANYSRHDSMQHSLIWAMECARAGIFPASSAIYALSEVWQRSVVPDVRRAELYSDRRVTEFDAMLRHAVGKVKAHPQADIDRIHDDIAGVRMNVPPPKPPPDVSQNGHAKPSKAVIHTADQLNVGPAPQLIRGWFPLAEITVVGGKPSVGKGVVLADIMARASRGDRMPNNDRIVDSFSSGVVCLPGEDSVEEWSRRLTVADAVLDRIMLVEKVKSADGTLRSVDAATAVDVVVEMAERGAKMIVVDSLTGLANSGGRDTNKGEVRAVLDALSQVARLQRISIILIHHVRKADGDPLDVLQGNTQIAAAARAVLIAVEERVEDGAEPDVRLFGVAKLNGSKRSAPVGYRTVGKPILHPDGQPMRDDRGDIAYVPLVQWVTDRTFTQGELIAASNGTVLRGSDRDQAAVDILADGPLLSTEYTAQMADAGYSNDQAKRARKAIGRTIRIDEHWWSYSKALSPEQAKNIIEGLIATASSAPV